MNKGIVDLVRTETEFRKLKESWNALSDESEYPNIFTTADWQMLWWDRFGNGPGNELFVLRVCDEDGRLLAVVPFYRTGKNRPLFSGRKHLHWIGYGGRTCPEYLGPIVRRGEIDVVVDAVVDFLRNHPTEWDSIFFEDYACDDPATACLAERLKREFASLTGPGDIRYVLPLPEDYETYLKSLGPHNRKGKRYRMNQAKKRHAAYATYPETDQIERWFPDIVMLTTESRIRLNQDPPFLDENYAGFHRELLRELLPKNRALVQFLYFSDEPVSCWYVFLLNGKCYAYQQGFKSNVKGGPGDAGTLFLLDKLMQLGISEFDFLRGLESYKTSYTDQYRETNWLFVFRRRGLNFWNRLALEHWVRPLVRRLRAILQNVRHKRVSVEQDS